MWGRPRLILFLLILEESGSKLSNRSLSPIASYFLGVKRNKISFEKNPLNY
jgi:hypothetical protein